VRQCTPNTTCNNGFKAFALRTELFRHIRHFRRNVVFGHTESQKAINAINELVEEAGKPEWEWQAPAKDEALVARLKREKRNAARKEAR
jgi:hypothetical protein